MLIVRHTERRNLAHRQIRAICHREETNTGNGSGLGWGGGGGERLGLKDREPNGTRVMKYAAWRALKFNPVC